MVLLATIVKMADERLIASMSTLMKSKITLRSESTVAARIIARVFPIIRDPSEYALRCPSDKWEVVPLTSAPNARARGYVGYTEMST